MTLDEIRKAAINKAVEETPPQISMVMFAYGVAGRAYDAGYKAALADAPSKPNDAWIEVKGFNEWPLPPHKTSVWVTYECAAGLHTVDVAWYSHHRSKWFWPWSTEQQVEGEVIAWKPYDQPKPFQPAYTPAPEKEVNDAE